MGVGWKHKNEIMQKKKAKISIASVVVLGAMLFSVARISQAAPGPWGLAINTQTKECAGYWPGDEFIGYSLPAGWKAYYPIHDPSSSWGKIQTEIGECSFQMQKEEACCMELGYAFVSRNIGKDQAEKLRDPMALKNQTGKLRTKIPGGVLFLLILIIAGLFFLFRFIFKKYISKKL